MICEIKGKILICGLIYATVLIANTKGFVNISFSTDETTKNSNLQIIAVTDESAVTWQRNSLQIGFCFVGSGCSSAVDNMVFAEVSATSTSTIDITSLNYTTNNAIFRVVTSNDDDQKTLTVYSPVTSISWTVVPSTPVTGTFVNLKAEIPCVYPPNQIEVTFNVYGKDGRNNTIELLYGVDITASKDSSCEDHEFKLTAEKKIYLSDVLDNVVQIIPTGSHRSLPSLGSKLGSITPEITLTSQAVSTVEMSSSANIPSAVSTVEMPSSTNVRSIETTDEISILTTLISAVTTVEMSRSTYLSEMTATVKHIPNSLNEDKEYSYIFFVCCGIIFITMIMLLIALQLRHRYEKKMKQKSSKERISNFCAGYTKKDDRKQIQPGTTRRNRPLHIDKLLNSRKILNKNARGCTMEDIRESTSDVQFYEPQNMRDDFHFSQELWEKSEIKNYGEKIGFETYCIYEGYQRGFRTFQYQNLTY